MILIIEDKATNATGGTYPKFEEPIFHGLMASGEYVIVKDDKTIVKFQPNSIDRVVEVGDNYL